MGLLIVLGLKPTGLGGAPAGFGDIAGDSGDAQPAPPNQPFADLGKGTDADKAAYRTARDKLKPRLDDAKKVRGDPAAPLAADLARRFDSTLGGIDTLEAQSLWLMAKNAMPQLEAVVAEVNKASADRETFRKAFEAARAEIEAAQKSLGEGLPLPEPQGTNLSRAMSRVEKARIEKDWATAGKGLPSLVAAAKAVSAGLTSGKKFYDALAAAKADRDAARATARRVEGKLGKMGPVGLVAANFTQADEVMKQLAAKGKWTEAVAAIDNVKAWGTKLAKASNDFDAASAPFQTEFEKLASKIANADRIDDGAPPVLKNKEGKAFRQALTAVNDARDAGEFAKATAALPVLKSAIADLEKADQALELVQVDLEEELGLISTQADLALKLAEAPPPSMKKLAADLIAANKPVQDAHEKKEWAAGKAALPRLKSSLTAFLLARDTANKGAGTQEVDALRKRMDALKPRTGKASVAPVTPHVGELQQNVLDPMAEFDKLLKASNVVDAEVQLNLVSKALDAMEKAKADHAAFLKKFEAARDGDVKKARDLALVPDKLAAVRTKTLDEAQASIVALADAGKTGQAEKAITAWTTSAAAWASSKAAYDSLHGDNPNAGTLAGLGAKAGGTDVLDALVADLGVDAPQKAMTAALKARYGVQVKRFEDRNEDVTDLSNLDANKPDAPDVSLVRTYALLGKVPTGNTKGKVTDLVVFDKTGGKNLGGYTEGGKVYLYAGRAEDSLGPDGSKHRLGKPGQVVPEGEEVDEACKPANANPPPAFDFMLLHEAAHTLDNSMSFMKGRMGNANFGNWEKHTLAEIAAKAASHFKYSEPFVLATLNTWRDVSASATAAFFVTP
jgi:hypothetical protein